MLDENRSDRAIIILDMINKFAHEDGLGYQMATKGIIPYILGEVKYFRERMRPVLFCNTKENERSLSKKNAFDYQVIQSLRPRMGEISIEKCRPNAFFKTELANILWGLKVKTLTIVGLYSHTSVLSTAASALDYEFSVVVPETCVCSKNAEDHLAALHLINMWLKA